MKTLDKIVIGLAIAGIALASSATLLSFKDSTRKYVPKVLGSVATLALGASVPLKYIRIKEEGTDKRLYE